MIYDEKQCFRRSQVQTARVGVPDLIQDGWTKIMRNLQQDFLRQRWTLMKASLNQSLGRSVGRSISPSVVRSVLVGRPGDLSAGRLVGRSVDLSVDPLVGSVGPADSR